MSTHCRILQAEGGFVLRRTFVDCVGAGGSADHPLTREQLALLLRDGAQLMLATMPPRPPKRLVVLESPYAGADAGALAANIAYARACLGDCLKRGEAPIASHLLFTQPGVLDDDVPDERALGIAAGHAWFAVADACVVYVDRGVSSGMLAGMEQAARFNVPIEQRSLADYDRALADELAAARYAARWADAGELLFADALARARGENLDGSPRRETVPVLHGCFADDGVETAAGKIGGDA